MPQWPQCRHLDDDRAQCIEAATGDDQTNGSCVFPSPVCRSLRLTKRISEGQNCRTMSVSLLTRRVAGLTLRSAGASPVAAAAASSLSALSGSGPAPVSSPGGGDIRGIGIGIGAGGGPQHRQQQMRGMSKKSKRAGGDDLVSTTRNSFWRAGSYAAEAGCSATKM